MGAVTDFDDLDNFNYTILEEMILGLNVIYPLQDLQRGGAISENDFREYIKNEKVIQFYSSAKEPYYNLSNLSIIREGIDYNGIKYPSTEHAYQAQKFIESDRKRFSLDGDLGNLSGFALVGANEQQWMKKYNIGIIAKMASSDKNIKKLKLTKDPAFDVNKNYDIWIKILREKYKLEWFKEILIGTGNAYLLEFSKGAEKDAKKGSPPFYSGLIKDGVLYGTNTMGKMLMIIRDELNGKFLSERRKKNKMKKSKNKMKKSKNKMKIEEQEEQEQAVEEEEQKLKKN